MATSGGSRLLCHCLGALETRGSSCFCGEVPEANHLTSSQKCHRHRIYGNVHRCKTRIGAKSPLNDSKSDVEKQPRQRVGNAVGRARCNATRHAKNAIQIISAVGPRLTIFPGSHAVSIMFRQTAMVFNPGAIFNFGSVRLCTLSGVAPAATSRRTRPCGVTSMTASSVTMSLTTPAPVSGRLHC
jgi:hypothetical protein